jgi:transcriptional regulator with XRE-family HTH domain
MSQPVVAAYERGRRSPSVPMLTKLLAAAGFELRADLVPARTLPDAVAASRTLEQALDLASALPRRRRALDLPPFTRRRQA